MDFSTNVDRKPHLVVVGGGAAGFFAAINVAEMSNGQIHITLLEKSRQWLGKVKISGGGRCNVTNGLTDPKEVSKFYPRGQKELLGALHTFGTTDTIQWFHEHGVRLKTEADGRVFPISDDSQTIIDCFMNLAIKYKISLKSGEGLVDLKQKNDYWEITTAEKQHLRADAVLMASGGSASTWEILANCGCQIVDPVPSLFTFNCKDTRLAGLLGISVPQATVSILGSKIIQSGPLLITHWGFSGPAILRLSAWGARYLSDCSYKFDIKINWTTFSTDMAFESLVQAKKVLNAKKIATHPQFSLPSRLWESLINGIIDGETRWADIPNNKLRALASQLTEGIYKITGKSTFKDEFVTSGGVALNEVNFKTMESKQLPGLYFAGEVLDIDGITGGFNFQAAWTTGWIAAKSIAKQLSI